MKAFVSFLFIFLALQSCFISAGGARPESFAVTWLNRQLTCSAAYLGPEKVSVYVSEKQAKEARTGAADRFAREERKSIFPRFSAQSTPGLAGPFSDALPAVIKYSFLALGFAALFALCIYFTHPLLATVAFLIFGFSYACSSVTNREFPDIVQTPVHPYSCSSSDVLFGLHDKLQRKVNK
jgi:hypothetical protein